MHRFLQTTKYASKHAKQIGCLATFRPVGETRWSKMSLVTRSLALEKPADSGASIPLAKDLVHSLEAAQKDAISATVPWFLSNMPASYFRAVQEEERLLHLNAMTSLRNAENPELLMKSKEGRVYSFIRSGEAYPGLLADVMSKLPDEVDGAQLARVKIFTSLDGRMSVDVFRFGTQKPFTGNDSDEQSAMEGIMAYCKDIQDGKYLNQEYHPKPASYFEPQAVEAFLKNCNSMYVQFSNPRRIATQIALYERVKSTEGVAVDIEHGWEFRNAENKLRRDNTPQHMITIAGANVLPKKSLQRAVTYLGLHNLNVERAHLDSVKDGPNRHVTLSRILVSPASPDTKPDWDQIHADLKYLKWIDDKPLKLALANPELGIGRAEIIVAYGHMLHGVLAKDDPFAYSLSRIHSVLSEKRHIPIGAMIADLFMARFNPQAPLRDEEFELEYQRIHKEIRKNVEAEETIYLFNKMLDAVKATLRTNRFVRNRYALALRMDPSVMGHGTVGTDLPFGTFFIHGRRFNGFHVRFRDISRGGLRVVAPPSLEQHSFESSRQYNEAYSLAFAQQLKNKDIPEGGSKAVLLVEPREQAECDREFVMRKSVKAFADALLDLNTTDEEVKCKIVDHYGKDELIYLGPDENIIPEDIVWMTKRAAYRKYPIPRAFISSKPDAGFNHKQYGVTSEGVAVFSDVALRSLGMNPHENPFTVKITGGTDGDVAGNMIKILDRDYGSNAKIVGICDGTAVVEDPNGLDMTEMLRLVHASLPLDQFNTSRLSSQGTFFKTDTREGVRMRNSMHNRVKADLFIPAGGRPSTINENNWQEFMDKNGVPSSKLVVEGANLFITPEARQSLFDKAGVVIVKDSSANKCGVITSSYEIIASMLLETEEFLAIKDEMVQDVLHKLRDLARVEAELLFREYKKDPDSALPPHSVRISRAIIRIHDAIVDALDSIDDHDQEMLYTIIHDHLPAKLQVTAADRVKDSVPLPYIKCIIAAGLASKIVYREGLQYAESMPASHLAETAFAYLKQEQRVKALAKSLEASSIQHADEIVDLLLRGGVRAGMDKI